MKLGIIGAGSLGTALGGRLSECGQGFVWAMAPV
jgi:ketopantoate reductase